MRIICREWNILAACLLCDVRVFAYVCARRRCSISPHVVACFSDALLCACRCNGESPWVGSFFKDATLSSSCGIKKKPGKLRYALRGQGHSSAYLYFHIAYNSINGECMVGK